MLTNESEKQDPLVPRGSRLVCLCPQYYISFQFSSTMKQGKLYHIKDQRSQLQPRKLDK